MPYPPSLPPASEGGAVLQPRQLQRWLDINPIHKLTRTQGYFNIPVFSADIEWRGYSDIVAVFNYTASNNFSMKSFTAPVNPTYAAFIAWVDADYVMHRYRLWDAEGTLFFFDAEDYTNQLIKKNFRIEIWSALPTGTFDGLYSFGAGAASANGTFLYESDTLYRKDASNIIELPDFSNHWAFIDAGLSEDYGCLNADFPLGPWYNISGGLPVPTIFILDTTSEEEAVTINTSILGGYDYRFAEDFAVATPSAIVTDFNVELDLGEFTLPFVWPADSVPTINV